MDQMLAEPRHSLHSIAIARSNSGVSLERISPIWGNLWRLKQTKRPDFSGLSSGRANGI